MRQWNRIQCIAFRLLLILILEAPVLLISPITLVYSTNEFGSFKIQPFWDEDLNYTFHYQKGNLSCGPACIQMVLQYFEVDPLPTQEKIAKEMNTTIYNLTYTNFLDEPFKNRNITIIFQGNFPNNFTVSIQQLKENILLNRPIIVLTWYDPLPNSTGHYRFITGYNKTGFFFHDPWNFTPYYGPNLYFNNSMFKKLWSYFDNWGIILESRPIELKIKIFDGGVSNNVTHVRKSETIWFKAEYEFTFETFDGSKGILFVNSEPMEWSSANSRWEKEYISEDPKIISFEVTGVRDDKYGSTTFFDGVSPLSIEWKRRGIPGFPYEAIALGIIVVILVSWWRSTRD